MSKKHDDMADCVNDEIIVYADTTKVCFRYLLYFQNVDFGVAVLMVATDELDVGVVGFRCDLLLLFGQHLLVGPIGAIFPVFLHHVGINLRLVVL